MLRMEHFVHTHAAVLGDYTYFCSQISPSCSYSYVRLVCTCPGRISASRKQHAHDTLIQRLRPAKAHSSLGHPFTQEQQMMLA